MSKQCKPGSIIVALALAAALIGAWPCAAQLTPVDMGVLAPYTESTALDVNSSGQAVGFCSTPGVSGTQGFVWQDGVMTALPPLAGYPSSRADNINDSGQVAGESYDPAVSLGQACLWEYDQDSGTWEVTGLGFLPNAPDSWVEAIDNAGQILGVSSDYGAEATGQCCRGFLWEDGVMTELVPGSPFDQEDPAPVFEPIGLSESGAVAGNIWWCSCQWTDVWVPGPAGRWEDGALTALTPGLDGQASAINSQGEVAGIHHNYDANEHGYFWWLPEAAYGQTAGLHWVFYSQDDLGSLSVSDLSDSGKLLTASTKYGSGYENSRYSLWDLAAPETESWLLDAPSMLGGSHLNADGDVIGHLFTRESTPEHQNPNVTWPFYRSADTGVLCLGSLAGVGPDWSSYALAINDTGLIVGKSATTSEPMSSGEPVIHAAVWDATQTLDHAPTLDALASPVVAVTGIPVSFTASATDPDGDAITYSLVGPPSGASIDPDTGECTVSNAAGYQFNMMIVAADPDGEWDSQLVQVKGSAGQPPVLAALTTPVIAVVGDAVTFTASATDPDAGDTLTFSLVGAPSGATINATTGAFSWTPTAGGSFTFSVKVTDAAGNWDSQAVTWNISALSVSNITLARNRKGAVVCTFVVGNPNATAANETTVTTASLGGVNPSSRMPLRLRTIRPGASKTGKASYMGVPAGSATLVVQGTSSLGPIYASATVNVP